MIPLGLLGTSGEEPGAVMIAIVLYEGREGKSGRGMSASVVVLDRRRVRQWSQKLLCLSSRRMRRRKLEQVTQKGMAFVI
jgi:hypothetical protein